MFTQKKLENKEGYHWESPLLKDLGFIKKNLRYPANKRTIWKMATIIAAIIGFVFTVSLIVLLSINTDNKFDFNFNNVGAVFAMFLVFLPMGIMIYKQYMELRFIVIQSPVFLLQNIQLIQQFLVSQNLSFYRHPSSPEVFQISSRILDSENELREIMVFIADEKRILINSHFTSSFGNNGKKFISINENKKMANALKRFIKEHRQDFDGQFSTKVIGK